MRTDVYLNDLFWRDEWTVKGYVRILYETVDELEGLDSILRENDAKHLRLMSERIDRFQAKGDVKTEDLNPQNPLWYWKDKQEDSWRSGMSGWKKKTKRLDDYPEIVPYVYFWITLENWAPTRNVCFAVLAAAARYGVSSLHPHKEGGQFQISVASSAGRDLMRLGSYTLSGIMRIA